MLAIARSIAAPWGCAGLLVAASCSADNPLFGHGLEGGGEAGDDSQSADGADGANGADDGGDDGGDDGSNSDSDDGAGSEAGCVPVAPDDITCDGIDDDCDGNEDEDCADVVPACDSVWDDFEDGSIDRKWQVIGADGPCTVTEDGAMRFIVDGTRAHDCYVAAVDVCRLEESSVMLEVSAITTFHPQLAFHLTAVTTGGDHVRVGFDGENAFFWEVKLDERMMPDSTDYEQSHRYWRIREEAGALMFETSPDARGWTPRLETPTPRGVSAVRMSFGMSTSGPMPGGIQIGSSSYNVQP